ncbi:unnamed protein product [Effrenium voratum]|nr:unnamed protein product [Effrenium voratum]
MSGAEFDSFVQQAQLILSGPPLDRQFLAGLWDGADKDLNRAINHLLGLPEENIVREGQGGANQSPTAGGGGGGGDAKKDKKHKKEKEKEKEKKKDKSPKKEATDDFGTGFGGGFDAFPSSFPDSAYTQQASWPPYQQPMTQPPPQSQPAYTQPDFSSPYQQPVTQPPPQSQPAYTQPDYYQQPVTLPPPQSQPAYTQPGYSPPYQQPGTQPLQQDLPQSHQYMSAVGKPPFGGTPDLGWESESDSENDWWNNPAPLPGPSQYGTLQSASQFPTQMAQPGWA